MLRRSYSYGVYVRLSRRKEKRLWNSACFPIKTRHINVEINLDLISDWFKVVACKDSKNRGLCSFILFSCWQVKIDIYGACWVRLPYFSDYVSGQLSMLFCSVIWHTLVYCNLHHYTLGVMLRQKKEETFKGSNYFLKLVYKISKKRLPFLLTGPYIVDVCRSTVVLVSSPSFLFSKFIVPLVLHILLI